MGQESFDFTEAVPVWAESGISGARFHSTDSCENHLAGPTRVFLRRYRADEDQLCPACGAALLDTPGVSSDRLAQLHQDQARLRTLAEELDEDGDCRDTISHLSRLVHELEEHASALPRARQLRTELLEGASTLLDAARENLAARRVLVH